MRGPSVWLVVPEKYRDGILKTVREEGERLLARDFLSLGSR